jgi:hypothetical protein
MLSGKRTERYDKCKIRIFGRTCQCQNKPVVPLIKNEFYNDHFIQRLISIHNEQLALHLSFVVVLQQPQTKHDTLLQREHPTTLLGMGSMNHQSDSTTLSAYHCSYIYVLQVSTSQRTVGYVWSVHSCILQWVVSMRY